MTDLPNLTKLFEQATERPWTIDERDNKHLRAPSGQSLMCDMQYYPWTPNLDEDWRLIAVAANNFEAMLQEVIISIHEDCPCHDCERRLTLLAKIEREAGEK